MVFILLTVAIHGPGLPTALKGTETFTIIQAVRPRLLARIKLASYKGYPSSNSSHQLRLHLSSQHSSHLRLPRSTYDRPLCQPHALLNWIQRHRFVSNGYLRFYRLWREDTRGQLALVNLTCADRSDRMYSITFLLTTHGRTSLVLASA